MFEAKEVCRGITLKNWWNPYGFTPFQDFFFQNKPRDNMQTVNGMQIV